ncbi:uncharacterized protein EI97DRAFT_430021 [Westerdykella ornata]|uniref:Acid phosphatase-like protein n=1 Tax=Westerdykella ornata TaxID=318751 RepID=A0A6A6JX15_WESOR|nr:uncharacterized protein EI97DRAFT_430021 [Westerdykella ornata]KAF2280276.1 hypothetical protein EI97DRAFT_430021 [Westerdykella ornata]
MNGGWIFLIVIGFLALASYGGWVVWSRVQANRLGLPPPSLNPFSRIRSTGGANYPAPAPSGIRGWFDTQIRRFKNRNNRYAAGAYEETGYGGGSAFRGGHRLDPDEAWDARVGNEAHYEEQELGLHDPVHPEDSMYMGSSGAYGYAPPSAGLHATEPERGRSRTREYDDGGSNLHAGSARDPFGDENATASLRGVSPRPLEQDTSYGGAGTLGATAGTGKGHKKDGSLDNSPTERRSIFREDM